jgi:hypothetical protein
MGKFTAQSTAIRDSAQMRSRLSVGRKVKGGEIKSRGEGGSGGETSNEEAERSIKNEKHKTVGDKGSRQGREEK